MKEDCIFCKIAAGEIPCFKVYEDDLVLSFLDIGPVVAGHTLVIPKRHYRNLLDVPAEALSGISRRLPMLARAVISVVQAPACHLLLNNGVEAMQSVQHLHYHILPRRQGDGFGVPWPAGRLEATTARQMAAEIAAAVAKAH
jgi:histidine triad (HIT) family protein